MWHWFHKWSKSEEMLNHAVLIAVHSSLMQNFVYGLSTMSCKCSVRLMHLSDVSRMLQKPILSNMVLYAAGITYCCRRTEFMVCLGGPVNPNHTIIDSPPPTSLHGAVLITEILGLMSFVLHLQPEIFRTVTYQTNPPMLWHH